MYGIEVWGMKANENVQKLMCVKLAPLFFVMKKQKVVLGCAQFVLFVLLKKNQKKL